jgi:transposase
MSNSYSRAPGIQSFHALGASYRAIARSFQCGYTTITDAIHSDIPPSPAIKRGRKKLITPEISRCIETLPLMDALLSNASTKAKV